jgi:LAO/AO transport system kinase
LNLDSAQDIAKELAQGNRRALSKAITLIESDLLKHRELVDELFPLLSIQDQQKETLRIGISGSPGVGKSTFIETLGLELIKKKHKVAVLAVDPSSPKSGGSILGDKTRMEALSQHDDAFIRPSPSKQSMGGVARSTREAILLCEACGFDIILIETVGVGQSEYDVASMVDFFYLLMLPNAGDELQGIKKGIIELADAIIVNKADGANKELAEIAKYQYESALKIIEKENFWQPNVLTCSSTEKSGFQEIINNVFSYAQEAKKQTYFDSNRIEQKKIWFKNLVHDQYLRVLFESQDLSNLYDKLENQLLSGKVSAFKAAKEMTTLLKNKMSDPK